MLNISLCQMNVVDNKNENVNKASKMIDEAVKKGTDIVVLPEMFCCPYDNTKFFEYSEEIANSNIVDTMSELAKKHCIYIVAGSIPERDENMLYNTSLVFDRAGNIIAKHRKIHLFDINVKGKIKFTESDVLSPGENVTVFDTEFCKIGLVICYDIRFPELSRIMALKGAKIIIIPGAFNMTTGPAHWELLARTRALDNQVYVAMCSPARDTSNSYIAYGNSLIVDPWGKILNNAGENENIIFANINLKYLEEVREELPVLKHRKPGIYEKYI